MLFEYLNLSEDRGRDINNLKKKILSDPNVCQRLESPIPLLIRLYQ